MMLTIINEARTSVEKVRIIREFLNKDLFTIYSSINDDASDEEKKEASSISSPKDLLKTAEKACIPLHVECTYTDDADATAAVIGAFCAQCRVVGRWCDTPETVKNKTRAMITMAGTVLAVAAEQLSASLRDLGYSTPYEGNPSEVAGQIRTWLRQ